MTQSMRWLSTWCTVKNLDPSTGSFILMDNYFEKEHVFVNYKRICDSGEVSSAGLDKKNMQAFWGPGTSKDLYIPRVLVADTVMFAFDPSAISKFASGLIVNHRNGRPYDNRLCNLELVTYGENILHANAMRLLSQLQDGLFVYIDETSEHNGHYESVYPDMFVSVEVIKRWNDQNGSPISKRHCKDIRAMFKGDLDMIESLDDFIIKEMFF